MTERRDRPLRAALVALDDARWAAFAARRPEAGPFHHPAWATLLADCYGRSAFAVAAFDAGGTIVAGMPVIEVRTLRSRRWISLPYSDGCRPLGDAVAVRELVALTDELRREERVAGVEIRSPLTSPLVTLGRHGFTHTLQLASDPGAVRETFNRSQVQRGIARAQREGVTVRQGSRPGDLLEVFYALHLATRRRQGVPIQPRRFFELLWERLLEPGLGFVLVAEHQGHPAAAAVFLAWNGTIVYKFGASQTSSWGVRPNHALFWAAVQLGCERGYGELDFGRTDAGNEGLRAFKRGWGTNESELVYSSLGASAPSPSGGASRLLGTAIRRAPVGFCRLVGEHLYRYAG
jgi:CelD/BcsL family acetyltransferase involved in cellulose biosynthesis